MYRIAPVLFATTLLATPAVAQDLQAAADAYRRGDYATALQHLQPLAARGDSGAHRILGAMYFGGEGVSRDAAAAAAWYRRAAEQGDAMAQTMLGALYEHGFGVPRDAIEAAAWYKRAAAQGGAGAQLSEDQWWRLSAAQGDAAAQHRLGGMYAKGEGAPQDFVLSYMWSSLAATNGNRKSAQRRDYLATLMPAEAVARAKTMAADWLTAQRK